MEIYPWLILRTLLAVIIPRSCSIFIQQMMKHKSVCSLSLAMVSNSKSSFSFYSLSMIETLGNSDGWGGVGGVIKYRPPNVIIRKYAPLLKFMKKKVNLSCSDELNCSVKY